MTSRALQLHLNVRLFGTIGFGVIPKRRSQSNFATRAGFIIVALNLSCRNTPLMPMCFVRVLPRPPIQPWMLRRNCLMAISTCRGVQDHDTQLPPPGSPTIWTEEAWARGDEGVPLDSDDDIQESQDTELQVRLCIPSQSSY